MTSETGEKVGPAPTLNEAAQILLRIMAGRYERGRSIHDGHVRLEEPEVVGAGVDQDLGYKAGERLVAKDLAEVAAMGPKYRITHDGVDLVANPQELERQLPTGVAAPPHDPQAVGRELNAVARTLLAVLHERRQAVQFAIHGGLMAYSEDMDELNLERETALDAFRRMESKALVSQEADQYLFAITEYGMEVAESPPLLDELLPVGAPLEAVITPGKAATRVADLPGRLGFLRPESALRQIIHSDLRELERALIGSIWKATMVLTGAVLEGLLLDVLDRNPAVAATYLRRGKWPDDASLGHLLTIAGKPDLIDGDRSLLTSTSIGVGHSIKDHRDLVHPCAQARERTPVDEEAAATMVQLLRNVVRDLEAAAERGDIATYERGSSS